MVSNGRVKHVFSDKALREGSTCIQWWAINGKGVKHVLLETLVMILETVLHTALI